VNVDGCRRVKSGVKKRDESCFRPLHLLLVTEKKKKIWVEGVKKKRPQTEKTSAFKEAGSDQFHIGPCNLEVIHDNTSAKHKDALRLVRGIYPPYQLVKSAFGPN